MNFISSNKMRVASLAVLLLGLVSVVIAYSMRPPKPQDIFILSERAFTPSGGTTINEGTQMRLAKADGSFVDIKKLKEPDGRITTKTLFSENGRGVFNVDEKTQTLSFVSGWSRHAPITEAQFRSQPNFAGEGMVLGFRVFIVRQNLDDTSYIETYAAPDLQWELLKMVYHNEFGTTVVEAKDVKRGAAAREALAFTPPSQPISYDHYEKKIEDVKKTSPKNAEAMRQLLEEKRKQHQQ